MAMPEVNQQERAIAVINRLEARIEMLEAALREVIAAWSDSIAHAQIAVGEEKDEKSGE